MSITCFHAYGAQGPLSGRRDAPTFPTAAGLRPH
ncbi:hypothetical protein FHR32_008364 [Streptosporangium album]|uniref:Uncharacterized protein n=1 Tax=Streptosporangium album TaxID=47479 RepID=A0A7W7WEK6_9ACTN|nr:hypothetical protein [Streptosporangium album]